MGYRVSDCKGSCNPQFFQVGFAEAATNPPAIISYTLQPTPRHPHASSRNRDDAIDGTQFDTFRLVKMSDALNASVRIDFVDIFAGVNRFGRTFSPASITIYAVFKNRQCHDSFPPAPSIVLGMQPNSDAPHMLNDSYGNLFHGLIATFKTPSLRSPKSL